MKKGLKILLIAGAVIGIGLGSHFIFKYLKKKKAQKTSGKDSTGMDITPPSDDKTTESQESVSETSPVINDSGTVTNTTTVTTPEIDYNIPLGTSLPNLNNLKAFYENNALIYLNNYSSSFIPMSNLYAIAIVRSPQNKPGGDVLKSRDTDKTPSGRQKLAKSYGESRAIYKTKIEMEKRHNDPNYRSQYEARAVSIGSNYKNVLINESAQYVLNAMKNTSVQGQKGAIL